MAVTNKLRFDMALLEHPYPAEADAHLEAWGRLAIGVLVEGHSPPFDYQMQVPLFKTQWDLAELAEWFALHRETLCDLTLPSSDDYPAVLPGESLAQALRRLTNREFAEHEQSEEDRWYEALYQFRTHHSLRFAQRGSRLPEIIIGCNYGVGEISLSRQEADDARTDDWSFLGVWAYPFDMNDFRNDLNEKLRNILAEWSARTPHAEARARAAKILKLLG